MAQPKFEVGKLYWFEGFQYRSVEVYTPNGAPGVATVTLRLVSRWWQVFAGSVPSEVVVGESRFDQISPVIGKT